MAPSRHPLRSYVVALFRHGDLVSVGEAVQICGASRQAISKWIKCENINIEAHRMARIAAYRTNAQRYLEGLPPLRRPSKAEMRAALEKAVRKFNEAQAKRDQKSGSPVSLAPEEGHGGDRARRTDVDVDL